MTDIKIGDIVKIKFSSSLNRALGWRFKAKILDVNKWEAGGPLTIENHGSIDIEVIESFSSKDLPIGTIEHLAYLGWQDHFEIVDVAEDNGDNNVKINNFVLSTKQRTS